ncbi:hypothetical protein SD37_10635 [Amycolatopsis orientalis]|uniref:Major facilitator superfamily (MFS) profile domain-containing protein n=1 Tax=Amycolatopsis orientalis TaxID=31958 RepID=A0A193BV08_AMYOR|nr:MFS transporter [Amycolatopsis orientalis]ANN16052.1 hypothetical protein SD37_10635 [Amycolatopsis orientalis]
MWTGVHDKGFRDRRRSSLGRAGATSRRDGLRRPCAIAPSIETLITVRLVQGVAGAMMLPQGLGILRDNLAPRDLTKALAIFGPVLGLGGVLGPVLGGALVDWNLFGLGWRLVFLVNVPVGLAALVFAWRLVPRGVGVRKLRVDVVGAVFVAAASALLVLPLNEGQAAGWPLWTWLSLSAAALGYVGFALWQRRVVRLDPRTSTRGWPPRSVAPTSTSARARSG